MKLLKQVKPFVRAGLSLFSLQAVTYLSPIVLVPYLTRVLGKDSFGQWAIAIGFSSIARTVAALGYDLIGARRVTLYANQTHLVSELFFSIAAARLVLLSASTLVLAGVAHNLYPLSQISWLVVIANIGIVGEVASPLWLYQGTGRVDFYAATRIASKSLYTVAVFLLIQGPNQLVLLVASEAIVGLAVGAAAMGHAIVTGLLVPMLPRLRLVREDASEGIQIFASQIAVHLYTSINLMITGSICSPSAVADYSVAERVYSAIRGLANPVVQVVYPSLARRNRSHPDDLRRSVGSWCLAMATILISIAIPIYIFARPITRIVSGSESVVSSTTLRILLLSLPFGVSSLLGPVLVIQGRAPKLFLSTLLCASLSLVLIGPFVWLYGPEGAALTFLCVQIANSTLLFLFARRHRTPEARR